MSNLSRLQISKIESLIKEGKSQREISKITGHGRHTVSKYAKEYFSRLISKSIEHYNSEIQKSNDTLDIFAFLVGLLLAIGIIMTLVYLIIN